MSLDQYTVEELINHLSTRCTPFQATDLVCKVSDRISDKDVTNRYSLFPIHDWSSYRRAKEHEADQWNSEEINFFKDKQDFDNLDPFHQKVLSRAFGFFAVGDGSVASEIAYRLLAATSNVEMQQFFIIQLANERVHGETYGLMILVLLGKTNAEKVLRSAAEVPEIEAMNTFIHDSVSRAKTFAQACFYLACAEYILFTPQFCLIFWFRHRFPGKLLQTMLANEFIARDEASHALNGVANYLSQPEEDRFSPEEGKKIITEVVDLVSEFANELFRDVELDALENSKVMNAENVCQYVQHVADDLAMRMGIEKIYGTENPFNFMNLTMLDAKTNFYEGRPAEYSRFNAGESLRNIQVAIDGKHEETFVTHDDIDF